MKGFVLVCCFFLVSTSSASTKSVHQAEQNPRAASLPTFDPSSSLSSRITSPPDSVQQRYRGLPNPSPIFHDLTTVEHARVERALQDLPAFARQVLTKHVRSISFVDGIPANATTIKDASSAFPVFDMVLRAGLLKEDTSESLTRKERSYYIASDAGVTLSVEAGSLPAVLYVLLHESVHVLDISNRAGQAGPPRLLTTLPAHQLVKGIWDDATTKVAAYQSPLFKMSWFGEGKPASSDIAEPTYRLLARTPFVSLYGSSNWYDDAAELVTCYYLTQRLQQPYRIVLHKGTETVFSLNPMEDTLVRARFPQISPLFG